MCSNVQILAYLPGAYFLARHVILFSRFLDHEQKVVLVLCSTAQPCLHMLILGSHFRGRLYSCESYHPFLLTSYCKMQRPCPICHTWQAPAQGAAASPLFPVPKADDEIEWMEEQGGGVQGPGMFHCMRSVCKRGTGI
jgi:hypothetical protein